MDGGGGGGEKEDLGIDRSKSLFGVHMVALLNKRLLTFKRDKKMWAFIVLMPAFFVLIGILILRLVSQTDEPSLFLTPTVSAVPGCVLGAVLGAALCCAVLCALATLVDEMR